MCLCFAYFSGCKVCRCSWDCRSDDGDGNLSGPIGHVSTGLACIIQFQFCLLIHTCCRGDGRSSIGWVQNIFIQTNHAPSPKRVKYTPCFTLIFPIFQHIKTDSLWGGMYLIAKLKFFLEIFNQSTQNQLQKIIHTNKLIILWFIIQNKRSVHFILIIFWNLSSMVFDNPLDE